MKTSKEIRKLWINFFESKKHKLIESSPLIPVNDNTLLWINSGVAALKKYFDGTIVPDNKRLVNIQKCIRTNDIENVGNTARHHTFFEMMGNFSIGDYFKKEAINYAYEILTSKDYFNLDINKLYFTIYYKDDEAYNYWKELNVKDDHIIRLESNYWQIGEGPCGPNTEVFYDRGEKYDKRGRELIELDIENDRFIEIWGIVFSQYNAKDNQKREEYQELPHKNIDTGLGLERICCILQDTKTNFETDLFMPIINKLEEISNIKYSGQKEFKVIADHIKAITMALYDGGMFSNEKRGYVLRRLLRRSLKYGRKLNLNKPFLSELVDSVYEILGDFYNLDKNKLEIIKKLIINEEKSFLNTLSLGEQKIEEIINKEHKVTGETAFLLYDTYGFPLELTIEYATEANLTVDIDKFQELLNLQKERARNNRKVLESMQNQNEEYLNFKDKSVFVGYNTYELDSKIIKIFKDGIVLDKTPFYATMGGQVCDKGLINDLEVIEVIKLPNGQHLHILNEILFKDNEIVHCKIDLDYRNKINKNHSATHLLHEALKEIIGNTTNQQGSYLDDQALRFDFNVYNDLNDDIILKIEENVNNKINSNEKVIIKEMKLEDAKKLNATALFTEKYKEDVRVVKMGDSIELCGGTHVNNTKDINHFTILDYYKIGAGIYRIEACTSNIMNNLYKKIENIKNEISNLLLKINNIINKAKNKNIILNYKPSNKIKEIESYSYIIEYKKYLNNLKEEVKNIEKEYQDDLSSLVTSNLDNYLKELKNNILIIKTNNIDKNTLKDLTDKLLDKINKGLVFIANIIDDKIIFISKNNINKDSGYLVKQAALLTNGNGGGRKDFAQAGGKDISKVDLALKEIERIVNE